MQYRNHFDFFKIGLLIIGVFFLGIIHGHGQWSFGMEVAPRNSQDEGLYHKIGYTKIDVKYSSPSVNNRKIWGELVPYDKVWRAGANNATTIEFSEAIEINGKSLAAGKYGFFLLPREKGKWEVIFNKVHDQWGAFGYNEVEDALRVQTLPVQSEFSENLHYTIEGKGPEYGIVYLNWERYKLGFEIKTNHLKHIEQAITKSYTEADDILKWLSYTEGAEYLLNQSTRLDLALEWINRSEKEVLALKKEWNSKYTPKEFLIGNMYWIKARILSKQNKYKEAIKNADKMKALTGNFLYYSTFEEQMKIDETIANWEKGVN